MSNAAFRAVLRACSRHKRKCRAFCMQEGTCFSLLPIGDDTRLSLHLFSIVSTRRTMLSRASFTVARRGTTTRFNIYRSFSSTGPLGDQYDVVVIGKIRVNQRYRFAFKFQVPMDSLVVGPLALTLFFLFQSQVEVPEDT